MMQLPQEFAQKMEKLLGEEYSSFLASYEDEVLHGLRVNTNKISVEDFLLISPFNLKPIPWIDNGFYFDENKDTPAKHPYYHAGLYYLQEPSAMTPASRLPIVPGDRVLDLCAAPGGKATELGARLSGKGLLVANDVSYSRAKTLLKQIERSGITNALVTATTPEKLAKCFPSFFTKVLVDAPCSGEGMFRKDKRMRRAWEKTGPANYVSIQRGILEEAYHMLAEGGYLLYSTCTFDSRENEENIQWFLEQHPDCHLEDMTSYEGFSKGNMGLQKCIRIFPHKMEGEGHFLALIKRDGEALRLETKPLYSSVLDPLVKEMCDSFLHSWNEEEIFIQGDYASLLKIELPKLKDVHVLRNGLLIGERKNAKWSPSQALAMSSNIKEYEHQISFSLSDVRVVKFLKGETLDVSDYTNETAAWFLVLVEAFPLGFGQVSRGRLKNKYPKSWLMM